MWGSDHQQDVWASADLADVLMPLFCHPVGIRAVPITSRVMSLFWLTFPIPRLVMNNARVHLLALGWKCTGHLCQDTCPIVSSVHPGYITVLLSLFSCNKCLPAALFGANICLCGNICLYGRGQQKCKSKVTAFRKLLQSIA